MNLTEYNILIKLISFVKYNCTDNESRYLAGSPIVNGILKKAIEELNSQIKRDNNFDINLSPALYNLVNEGVKVNLERTIEWNNMDIEGKKKHIRNLIEPYLSTDKYYEELLNYADEFHSPSLS